jgi:cysteine-rich repeat protein
MCGPVFTPTPSVTPTATGQPTLTPTTTATPTATRNPMCGNMTVEPGETCDDGNEEENDPCPNDCTIEPCPPAGTMRSVRVDFAPPPFQDASSITLLVTYPDGTVGIPGSGDDDSVGSRITQRQSGSIVTPNDLDHALRAVYSRPGRISPGRIFTLTFDDCVGALPPQPDQFSCRIVSCANSNGPLDDCTCSVVEAE